MNDQINILKEIKKVGINPNNNILLIKVRKNKKYIFKENKYDTWRICHNYFSVNNGIKNNENIVCYLINSNNDKKIVFNTYLSDIIRTFIR